MPRNISKALFPSSSSSQIIVERFHYYICDRCLQTADVSQQGNRNCSPTLQKHHLRRVEDDQRIHDSSSVCKVTISERPLKVITQKPIASRTTSAVMEQRTTKLRRGHENHTSKVKRLATHTHLSPAVWLKRPN